MRNAPLQPTPRLAPLLPMLRRSASVATPLFLVFAGLQTAACNLGGPADAVLGEEARAYFRPGAPADTRVFSQGVMVGAAFEVRIEPRDEQEDAPLVDGTLRSTDDRVFIVEHDDAALGRVKITGAGEAQLELVHDGAAVDRIIVRGQYPEQVFLADGSVNGSDIDPRLPVRFGIVEGENIAVTTSFQGRCGGAVTDAGAVTLESADPSRIDVEPLSVGFDIEALSEGSTEVKVMLDGNEMSAFDVEAVRGVDVDTVTISIASTTETSAQLWGRAFAANTEVIGQSYMWSATPRMTLSQQNAPYTQAAILPVDEDAAPEVQAAQVDMQLFGINASIDLLVATNDQVSNTRLPVVEEAAADPVGSGGCAPGATDACDPYAAALGFGALGLGRLRRRRRAAA